MLEAKFRIRDFMLNKKNFFKYLISIRVQDFTL